jgi:hypothetical protein
VARYGTISDCGGAFGDVDHAGDPAPSFDAAALLADGSSRPQTSGQLTLQLAPSLHEQRLVDRLVAHPHLRVIGEVQR